ncbi:MAG: ATP-binding cassette domain-containing protein [Amnibacterium sp.]
MDDLVVASDLSIDYPPGGGRGRFTAVRGVTFRVARGELFGIVGENGAGKSTLARMIAGRGGTGTTVVSGGGLSVLGTDVRRLTERGRRRLSAEVGYLPQQAFRTLDRGRTVAENVAQPLFERDHHFDRREAGRRAAELVDAVQLPWSTMAQYPHELTPGQCQRVAIARSLILEPALWVADEPTGGADVPVKAPVLDTLLELQSERDFTALIVSHDAAVMSRLTDRVAVMHGGMIVGLGSLEDVLARPTHPYVRGLRDDYLLRTAPITLPHST